MIALELGKRLRAAWDAFWDDPINHKGPRRNARRRPRARASAPFHCDVSPMFTPPALDLAPRDDLDAETEAQGCPTQSIH